MESPGLGMLGRVGEKVLGYIALALLVLGGIAIYQVPAETKGAIWSGVWRTAAWLVFSAVWPWVTWLFIRRIAELGTNLAGLVLVGGLLVGNLIVAALLMTGWPAGAWSWLLGLTLLALAGTYNYLVAEYLAENCE